MTEQENQKIPIKGVTKYLREISVFAIGVAITILVSSWVAQYREKQELKEHLQAVKTELESNLEMARECFEYYDQLLRFSYFVKSKPLEEHTEEGIVEAARMHDGRNITEILYFTLAFETVSFDLLKESGTTKHIRDKELWRSIMLSYKALEELKHESDTYMEIKVNYMFSELQGIDINNYWVVSNLSRGTYNFYCTTYNFNNVFDKVFDTVGATLSKF